MWEKNTSKKKTPQFAIPEKIIEQIKTHINSSFDISNSMYPLSICGTCRITLKDHDKD